MLLPEIMTFGRKKQIIESQVRRNNSTIYGGQSLRKQMGLIGRETKDYDVYSDNPQKSALELERTLDKSSRGNVFYTKQSENHPSTWKVKHVGIDGVRGTEDDQGIADFTQKKQGLKTVTLRGTKYAAISEVEKDKKKSLANKSFSFRHKKDADDLRRIKLFRGLR